METKPTSWLNDNIKPIGALIILIGVITYLFMVTLISNDITIRSQAIIAIVGFGGSVLGYYYGYSQGASKKDEAISTLSGQPTITKTGSEPSITVTQPVGEN